MKKIILISILLFICFNIFGLTVEYIEGYIDIKDGDEWVELLIGDEVTEDDVIKLGEDSFAVLSGYGFDIKLTKPSIYYIKDIIGTTVKRQSFAGLIGDKIKTLTQKPERAQSVVAGVRASERINEGMDWSTGDGTELLSEAVEFFDSEEYEIAIEVLWEAEEATNVEDVQTLQLIYLLLGMCCSQIDEFELASEYFESVIELDDESEPGLMAKELLMVE